MRWSARPTVPIIIDHLEDRTRVEIDLYSRVEAQVREQARLRVPGA
jgi:hypothetical protein